MANENFHASIGEFLDPQAEYDPTEPSTEHHFNRSPRLPGQHIQVTCKSDTREQIGEEDIDGRSDHKLIEYRPVGDISNPKIVQILPEKAEGAKAAGKAHLSAIYRKEGTEVSMTLPHPVGGRIFIRTTV